MSRRTVRSTARAARLRTGLLAAAAAAPLCGIAQPPSSSSDFKPAGTIERVSVHGPSLEGNLSGDSADRMVSVYLPPSYERERERRYPVVYLLHGFTDTDTRWFSAPGEHFVSVPAAADRAYAAGAREVIIVMPDALTKYFGSMYSSSAATGDWESFVAKDLVEYVDAHYRTLPRRESRGLAGHSMGGYGTFRIGMKHSGVFSSLYSLSPCCMAPAMEPSPELMAAAAAVDTPEELQAAAFGIKAMLASAAAWSANPKSPPRYLDLPIVDGKLVPDTVAKWAANAPLTMLHQYVPSLRSFAAVAVDAGDLDAGIAATVRSLSATLTDYGIEHTAEIYAGDHLNRVEERLERKTLPFFSAHLTFQ